MNKLAKKVLATGTVFVEGARHNIGSDVNQATLIIAAGLGAINNEENRLKGAFDAAVKQAAINYAIDGVQAVIRNRKLIKEVSKLEED